MTYGATPSCTASQDSHMQAVEALLEAGASEERVFPTESWHTPLTVALLCASTRVAPRYYFRCIQVLDAGAF